MNQYAIINSTYHIRHLTYLIVGIGALSTPGGGGNAENKQGISATFIVLVLFHPHLLLFVFSYDVIYYAGT